MACSAVAADTCDVMGAASVDPETAIQSMFDAAWHGAPAGTDIPDANEETTATEIETATETDKASDDETTRNPSNSNINSKGGKCKSNEAEPRPIKSSSVSAFTSITGHGAAVLPGSPNSTHLPVLEHVVLVYRLSSLAAGAEQTSHGQKHAHKQKQKHKPTFVTKKACLLNFVAAATAFANRYPTLSMRIVLIKDCCDKQLARFADYAFDSVLRVATPALVFDQYTTSLGSNAKSFCYALDALRALPPSLLEHPQSVGVYMCEDDYMHEFQALSTIFGGLALASLSAGYDHPDKYVNGAQAGNPFVQHGGEVCRVLLGAHCHYKTTNSTTMTFCSTLRTLFEDDVILRTCCATEPPDDFHMFLALGTVRGRTLVTPLPSACTHGESAFLAPFFPAAKLGAKALALLSELELENVI
jgi:hypothetical protein